MLKIDEYIQLVNEELRQRTDFSDSDKPRNLYKPIEYTLESGGKRIRAIMVLIAANLFKEDIEDVIPVALAIEVFHNFTLVHDDIMDSAAIRRGKPTVHKKWDQNTAILSGDAMMILAWQLLSETNKKYLSSVLVEFNKVALEVCEGQQLDMDMENAFLDDDNVTVSNYLHMIRLKTSVLLASSLKIGAILGGADSKDAEVLYEFGINLGMAFQLQDDYLDTFGDEKTFGKTIGGDILEGKKTYLTTKTKELADGLIWNDFLNVISNNSTTKSEKISRVRDLYNYVGAKEEAEKLMDKYLENAIICLEKVSIDDSKKKVLTDIAQMLNKRKS